MAAPLITAITTVPNRENATNQASFSNDVDTFFSEVHGFQTEANAQAQYLDGVAAQVDADAATALSAKNSAVAAANYRGDWTVSSDVKQGESYTHLGKEWIAKQDSVNVTPVEGAFWIEGFGDAVNVRYDNTASGLAATDAQGAIDELGADITELSTANNARTRAALNASGDAPIYACRAWASINMVSSTIRASGNVIGVTVFGVGQINAVLGVGMVDLNYSCVTSFRRGGATTVGGRALANSFTPVTTTEARLFVTDELLTPIDPEFVFLSVFR